MPILAFAVLLTALIMVHELGHFFSARRAGIRVEEFGLGLPPRLIGVQRDAGTGRFRIVPGFWSEKKPGPTTVYSLNFLPIGGFVRIFGENGVAENDPRSFASQSWWVRVRTIIAGVAMNMALAIALITIGFQVGLPVDITGEPTTPGSTTKIQIAAVAPGSPAAVARLKIGDTIIQLRYQNETISVRDIEQVRGFIARHSGEQISLVLERGNSQRTVTVVPRPNPPAGEGALGIAMSTTTLRKLAFVSAIRESFVFAFQLAGLFLVTLGDIFIRLFTVGRLPIEIAGPVGIAAIVGDASQLGFIYLLNLAAVLSINLAVINILPFPALDGGRLLFLIIEKIKGSPVSRRVEQIAHSVGMALLLLAILAISVQDLRRFFRS